MHDHRISIEQTRRNILWLFQKTSSETGVVDKLGNANDNVVFLADACIYRDVSVYVHSYLSTLGPHSA